MLIFYRIIFLNLNFECFECDKKEEAKIGRKKEEIKISIKKYHHEIVICASMRVIVEILFFYFLKMEVRVKENY